MLSINPQRGKAQKLRLMCAYKCEDCSTGLCLTLHLLAIEAFMQRPLVGGKMEALPLHSASSSRLSLPRLLRAWDQVLWEQGRQQVGFSTFLGGVPSLSTPLQKARGAPDICPPAVLKGKEGPVQSWDIKHRGISL